MASDFAQKHHSKRKESTPYFEFLETKGFAITAIRNNNISFISNGKSLNH